MQAARTATMPTSAASASTPVPSSEQPRRIVALAFESPLRAQEAMLAAIRLQEQGLLRLHDAVMVTREESGHAEVTTLDPTAVAAAVPSSLFGALIGTLVAGPIGLLVGGAIGGGGGALVARLIDTGIPHRVVGELQELTKPGQSVLALLVSDLAGMAIIEELRRFRGAHVVYAQLPPAALALMQQALADQQKS
jgi:uncharacterized membrane protein